MKFKFNQLFAGILAMSCLILALPAQAQFYGFSVQRSIVLASPRILDSTAAYVTNGPIDISGYLGEAYIDITTFTNAGGALTATLYNSSNSTNGLTALSNFALINSTTSYAYTNLTIGTNVYATNPYLLPGTITTPTAATAGWATPYLAALPFTNTGAITVTTKGTYRVGIRAQDALRYLFVVWTPTGASSNDVVQATFNGVRGGEVQ
jgi:hypothetical protein